MVPDVSNERIAFIYRLTQSNKILGFFDHEEGTAIPGIVFDVSKAHSKIK